MNIQIIQIDLCPLCSGDSLNLHTNVISKATRKVLDFSRKDLQAIWNWLFDFNLILKAIFSSIPEKYSVKSILYSEPSSVKSLENFLRFLFTVWKQQQKKFCLLRLKIPLTPCHGILINSYFYMKSSQVSGTFMWKSLRSFTFLLDLYLPISYLICSYWKEWQTAWEYWDWTIIPFGYSTV